MRTLRGLFENAELGKLEVHDRKVQGSVRVAVSTVGESPACQGEGPPAGSLNSFEPGAE